MALCAAAVVVVVVTSISKLPSILCMLAVLVPNMDYRNNFGANCSMFAMKNVSNILNLLYNAIYVKKKPQPFTISQCEHILKVNVFSLWFSSH